MKDLKDEVKKHYSERSLREYQIDKLIELQKPKGILGRRQFMIGASVATVAAVMGVYYKANHDLLYSISKEVAYNHNKSLPSEFLVDKVSKLNSRLTKLDYKLLDTPKLANYNITGGRYCSIQGLTTAQIKMNDKDHTYTLYQSNFIDFDQDRLPYKATVNNVEVELWMEGGLLHAKANSI